MDATSAKDRLYLLRPDFTDGAGAQFCVECAMVEGMLSFYPELRKKLDVHYIGFQRPRPQLVAELGEEHQSSPCLILGGAPAPRFGHRSAIQTSRGKSFLNDPHQICDYLAAAYGFGAPHR